MPFKKKETSSAMEAAKPRLAAVKKIDADKKTTIDYGAIDRPLTAVEYEAQMKIVDDKTEKYNQALQVADTLGDELEVEELKLSKMNSEILSSGRGKFGGDSLEYQQLGGVRTSERKKRGSKGKDNGEGKQGS